MNSRPDHRHTRGVALPVVLLFLLIITIGASFGIRRATLGEGIARNQLDYEVARQAAEAALRDAERDLMLISKPAGAICDRGKARPIRNSLALGLPYFDSDCPKGQCRFALAYYNTSDYTASPPVNPHPWWPTAKNGLWNDGAVDPASNCNFKGAVPLGTFTGSPKIQGVAAQPEYIVEYMARGDDFAVRITARGFGADRNTETVLQTYFRLDVQP